MEFTVSVVLCVALVVNAVLMIYSLIRKEK